MNASSVPQFTVMVNAVVNGVVNVSALLLIRVMSVVSVSVMSMNRSIVLPIVSVSSVLIKTVSKL